MPEIIIPDMSCLILLEKIGKLELLHKVYDNIVTTPEIAKEFLEQLPSWINIEDNKDKK